MKTGIAKIETRNVVIRSSIALLAVIFALFYTGCEPEKVNQNGKFDVKMTDSPGNFEAMLVTLTHVEIFAEGEGWIDLKSEPMTINIAELTNGREVTIASTTELDAGFYSKVKLVFEEEGEIVTSGPQGSTTTMLDVQKEVEIPLAVEFDGKSETSATLDFHVTESVVEYAGEVVIDPVIEWMEDLKTGISGTVSGSQQVVIEMYADGENTVSYSSFTDATGQFLIRGMEEGTYDLKVLFTNELGAEIEFTVEDIVIVEGEIFVAGTIDISLG